MIYYLTTDSRDAIKIGHSKDPAETLERLNSTEPNKIMMRVVEGDEHDLTELHNRFYGEYGINGDWFEYSGEILKHVGSLREQCLMYQLGMDDSGPDPDRNVIAYHRQRRGISPDEMGHRMDMPGWQYLQYETLEQKGHIRIFELDMVARELGCRLEYRFVPDREIRERARQQMALGD